MSTRICPVCEIRWPATEVHTTTFGSKTSTPINESCPACGNTAWYDGHSDPSPEDERNEALALVAERHAAEARVAEFEAYYTEYALRQLAEEIDAWQSPAPA
jgi:hypothetical protein